MKKKKKKGVQVQESRNVSLRMSLEGNHYLEARVKELKALAGQGQRRSEINKTWLIHRLMELGIDFFDVAYLGVRTPFEKKLHHMIVSCGGEKKKAYQEVMDKWLEYQESVISED